MDVNIMSNIIYEIIYKLPLDYIVRAMFLLLLLWSGLEWVFRKKLQKTFLWICGNALIFLGIVVVITRMTLYTRGGNASEVILVPLHSFVEAKTQPEMYRSMLMNVFLFFPIGLSLPNVLPEKWEHPVLIAISFAFLFSLGIEFLQYYYNLGRAEIDDVFCNTFGCAIGTLAYVIEKKIAMKQSLQQK